MFSGPPLIPLAQEKSAFVNIRLRSAYEAGIRQQLPASARLLLMCYARHANMETGEVCISQARIEDEMGLAINTSKRMTRVLLEAELLIGTGKHFPGKERGYMPVYIVAMARSSWGMLEIPAAADTERTAFLPGEGQMEMVPFEYQTVSRPQAETFLKIAKEAGMHWGRAKAALADQYDIDLRGYELEEIPAEMAGRIFEALKEMKGKLRRGWTQREAQEWINGRTGRGDDGTEAAPQEGPAEAAGTLPRTGPVDPRAAEVWEIVHSRLRAELAPNIYSTWLEQSRGAEFRGTDLIVEVPSQFVVEVLEQRLYQTIRRVLLQCGEDLDVRFTVSPESDVEQ